MPIDLTQFPYLDRTEEERQKGYVTMLGVPGRYLQARELTQLQRYVQLQLRDLANTLFQQGAIVEGCQLIIKNNQATITPGKIYYNGFILPVPETTFSLRGTGTETIGVVVNEEIITEEEDPLLRDQYQSGWSYGRPGMHRVRMTVTVVKDQPTPIILYEIVDGQPVPTKRPQAWHEIINILARRTYDESENYLVRGLETQYFPREDGKADVIVSPGKAYVLGYEIELSSPTIITVSPSTDTMTVTDELYQYTPPQDTYLLYHQPVAQVLKVMANVQVTNYNMVRGTTIGGVDVIPFQNIINVVEVRQGSTVYQRGVDYNIISGNLIDWSPSGNEPSPGTNYTVTFVYHKTLTQETEYRLIQGDQGTAIKLLPPSGLGESYVPNSLFEVDYTCYLGRIDILCLDSEGKVKFINGVPALPRYVQRPEVPNDVLPLAEIYFPPNSNQLQVTNYNLKRLTMFELNRLLDKLKQLEYNLAVTQLDDPLRVGASPINMKGIFSEGFVDFSKASLTHPIFNGIIVPSFGIFVPDYSSIEQFVLVPETTTNVSIGQNFITLPYTSRPFLAQLQANRAVTINQYMVFTRIPIITADPPSRTFYEKVIIKESTATHITTVHHTIHTTNRTLIGHRTTSDRILSEWFEEKLLKKEAMTFIPDCTLTIYGTDFYPNQDNLVVYFDGVQLPANPINNTPQGTAPGTVKSKSDGTLAFIINIPGNRFYTGWKKIELKNQYQNAETSFYATGTRELYEKIRHVNIRRDVTTYVAAPPPDPRPADPCAQSFFVPEPCFITGVGLFFRKKDNNIPIRVSLRPLLDSGLPSQEILAQKTVQPSEIVVSQNASAETVVLFPEPVFVEGKKMYCIVLDTDSNNYEIFVAEMGQTDLLTGAPISKQPYLEGNFFSSSDAFSWTVHQTTDMKFRIYRAEFTATSGTLITNNVSTQFTSLLTNFDTHIPDGTSLTLYYSINNGATWNPITNLNATELNTVGTQLRFRIDFATTNRLLTPRILKNMEAITFLPKTSATYISRAITVPANSNNLELWVDIFRPSATLCNGSVSYSRDGGNSWIPLTYNQQEVTAPALNWERRKYTTTLPANTTTIQIRVDLQTTNVLYQPACSNLIAIFR